MRYLLWHVARRRTAPSNASSSRLSPAATVAVLLVILALDAVIVVAIVH